MANCDGCNRPGCGCLGRSYATQADTRNCQGCYSSNCRLYGCAAKQADAALDSFVQYTPAGIGQKAYYTPVEPTDVQPVEPEPSNQMYQSMKATFSKCLAISERKSADYARGENPYRNFETVTRIGVSVQQGILIRTLDKITRLENLLTVAPYVTEETFEDTIDDAINYLAILKARREFERTN